MTGPSREAGFLPALERFRMTAISREPKSPPGSELSRDVDVVPGGFCKPAGSTDHTMFTSLPGPGGIARRKVFREAAGSCGLYGSGRRLIHASCKVPGIRFNRTVDDN